MKRIALGTALALLLTVATGSSELNLKPRLVTMDFAGHAVRRAYFMDGDKKFAVTLDNDTEMTPHGEGALFCFKKIPLATVELRRSPIKAGTPINEQTISAYAKAAA